MPVRFAHDSSEVELRAGYPPPCSDDERVSNYEATFAAQGVISGPASVHNVTSWILARLAALTHGDIQDEHGAQFCNDGGEFGYRFTFTGNNGELIGKCGVVFYRNRIEFAGFSKAGHDIRLCFTKMLTDSPNDLGRCSIESVDAETGEVIHFGYDGGVLL